MGMLNILRACRYLELRLLVYDYCSSQLFYKRRNFAFKNHYYVQKNK